ncbi:MAG: glycosyltransferase family 39 protein, partial [Ignavibacteria bacterium]
MREDAERSTVDRPHRPHPILPRAVYPLIIVIAVCVVYGQAVRFDFVSYDDYDLITQNTDYLGNFRNLAASFTTHVFSTHRAESAYYRPLLLASFIIDYRLWGLSPFGFHLVNILLHAAAAVVLYFLALRVTRESAVAGMTSLLFALHPVQTEPVAWISGRNDILLGLWILLMVFCFIRSGESSVHRRRYSVLSALFFTIALFTKEAAAFYI